MVAEAVMEGRREVPAFGGGECDQGPGVSFVEPEEGFRNWSVDSYDVFPSDEMLGEACRALALAAEQDVHRVVTSYPLLDSAAVEP